MISNEVSNTETVRNVYIIDPQGIIRLILVYPMNVGRCIPEILRVLQALQVADNNQSSMPANWVPCEPTIIPPPRTFEELMQRNEQIQRERNGMNWYLSFKNAENCKSIEEKHNNKIK